VYLVRSEGEMEVTLKITVFNGLLCISNKFY
jgi:hypothetical protein